MQPPQTPPSWPQSTWPPTQWPAPPASSWQQPPAQGPSWQPPRPPASYPPQWQQQQPAWSSPPPPPPPPEQQENDETPDDPTPARKPISRLTWVFSVLVPLLLAAVGVYCLMQSGGSSTVVFYAGIGLLALGVLLGLGAWFYLSKPACCVGHSDDL